MLVLAHACSSLFNHSSYPESQATIRQLLLHLPKKECRLFISLRSKPTAIQEAEAKSGGLRLLSANSFDVNSETQLITYHRAKASDLPSPLARAHTHTHTHAHAHTHTFSQKSTSGRVPSAVMRREQRLLIKFQIMAVHTYVLKYVHSASTSLVSRRLHCIFCCCKNQLVIGRNLWGHARGCLLCAIATRSRTKVERRPHTQAGRWVHLWCLCEKGWPRTNRCVASNCLLGCLFGCLTSIYFLLFFIR